MAPRGGSPRARRRRTAAGSPRAWLAPARSAGASGTRGRSSAPAGRGWRTTSEEPYLPAEGPILVARLRDPAESDEDPRERDDDRAHADARVRRISGATATEYAAQVAHGRQAEEDPFVAARDVSCPSRGRRARHPRPRPPRRPRSALEPLPAERDPEEARRRSGSRRAGGRSSRPSSTSSASTNESWFSQSIDGGHESEHDDVATLDSQRPFRGERQRDEDRPGEGVADGRVRKRLEPCSRMYFVTLRFSAQSRTVARA